MVIEKNLRISNAGTRAQVRRRVIREFLKELPGTGGGDLASKYFYFVETLSDGSRVYITRPTNSKGFDFDIKVENRMFASKRGGFTNRPRHEVIYGDLLEKKRQDPLSYARLFELIERIYNCQEVTPQDYSEITFAAGLPVDMILAVIKWFFIEQDVTYWNYSGRAMPMLGMPRCDAPEA